jgi:hypothetical protein
LHIRYQYPLIAAVPPSLNFKNFKTMMSTRLLSVPFLAASLFLSSCGGGGDEKTTTTTDSTTTTTTTAAAPAETVAPSTISTTPQAMMIVRHKAGDFAKWQMSYDDHDSMRLANGIHNYVIGRGAMDSSTVLVATKADDMAKAKAFAASASLKQAMQKAGVTGKPSISYITAVYQDTAVIPSPLRSMTTFTVKDWTAWEKAFQQGKQERIDNGLIERVYGHDADNDKKVMLVTAITDTAKANAYWKSDMLKKRREAGGVIGEPERFVFRIVKRY